MITNFENITYKLTEEEKNFIPFLISGFENHGKENPIKAEDIVIKINAQKSKYNLKKDFTPERMRKMCNLIRTQGIIPLCATSKGYFVSYALKDINSQIKSLQQRADAIYRPAHGLKKFL
jgi:hypothetical protein